jgi:hypothetical protein
MTPSQFANHAKSHVDCNQEGCDFVGLRAIVSAHAKEKHPTANKGGSGNKRKVQAKGKDVDQEVEDYVAERKRKYKERILGKKMEDGEVEEGEWAEGDAAETVVGSVKPVAKAIQPPSKFKKAKKDKDSSFLAQVCIFRVNMVSCLWVRLMKKSRDCQMLLISLSKPKCFQFNKLSFQHNSEWLSRSKS